MAAGDVLAGIVLADWSTAMFTTYASHVLQKGQLIYLDDQSGLYKKGDGVSTIGELSFLGGNSTAVEWGNITGDIPDQTDLVDYIQNQINTVIRDRGNYDASGNVFPSAGGSGSGGSVELGNQWTISVSGVLGGEAVTAPYDIIRALVDNPGNVRANWFIQHSAAPVIVPGSVVQRSGTELLFNGNANYGTISVPESTNITVDFTGSVLGAGVLVIHNNSSEPTYPASFKKNTLSGNYVPNVVNFIYCEFLDTNNVIYNISQRA